MKTIKLVLSIVALTVVSTASAQFTNSTQSTKESSKSTTTANLSSWKSIYISVDSPVLIWDGGDEEEKFDCGFSLGFTSTKVLSDTTPIFAEYGAEFSYAYYDDGDDYNYIYNFFNAVIPINLIYLYSINENFSVAPYVGLYARVGISFNIKHSLVEDGEEMFSRSGSAYDKDYMDFSLNRFTYGYQLGVNLQFKDKYIVGLKWQNDINEMSEDLKYKNGVSINLGFKF